MFCCSSQQCLETLILVLARCTKFYIPDLCCPHTTLLGLSSSRRHKAAADFSADHWRCLKRPRHKVAQRNGSKWPQETCRAAEKSRPRKQAREAMWPPASDLLFYFVQTQQSVRPPRGSQADLWGQLELGVWWYGTKFMKHPLGKSQNSGGPSVHLPCLNPSPPPEGA